MKLNKTKFITIAGCYGDLHIDDKGYFCIIHLSKTFGWKFHYDLSKKIIDTVKSMKKFNTTIFNLNKKDFIMELILRDESIFKMINPFITNVIFYDYPYIDTVEDVYNLTYEEYIGKKN